MIGRRVANDDKFGIMVMEKLEPKKPNVTHILLPQFLGLQ